MELYILSKQDLSILSICKVASYEINLDEETNAKTIFTLMKTNGLQDGNFLVLNGLYRQFLFVIENDGVQTEKNSDVVTVTALDISNIFNRKVIEKNIETMKTKSIEEFIANTMYENFVNSEDTILNINYIDIAWHTNTQANVATNAENGLYNFHTFLINCRQYKNIYTEFKFENNRLKIDIAYKEDTIQLIDTTLSEVIDYNKTHEEDVTAKVQVYVREDESEYNLYLRTDRTTTTDKDDKNRAKGKIEVISVDTADKAHEEALNVLKGNSYKHLVEFKIAKTSKLMDITKLHVGCPVRIKTDDDIYDSYISAITLTDENFVYFKSGSLRNTLLDKLKKNTNSAGNKLDKSGGSIQGNLDVRGQLTQNNSKLVCDKIHAGGSCNDISETCMVWINNSADCPAELNGANWGFLITQYISDEYICQIFADANSNRRWTRSKIGENWQSWDMLSINSKITYGKIDNQTITANSINKIELNQVVAKAGSRLTVNGNDVVIGAGVSKIKVNGNAWIESFAYKWLFIYKNEEQAGSAIFPKNPEETWGCPTISSRIITVNEGDRISLRCTCSSAEGFVQAGTYLTSTYLTVEVIE